MKIDPKEMQQVVQAQGPRFDMYASIHKGLRALMADTLLAVGRMDCTDDLELAQTTERVLQLLDFCRSHLKHENDFVHAAMEARAPGASEAIAHEHEDHVQHIAHLGEIVAALRHAPGDRKFAEQQRLYGELTLFVADNFRHMRIEETAHNAVLWARYTDAELLAIHDALIASIPPQEMMFAMRWMVPFMSPMERAGMLADVRSKAPAPAFAAILETVRPHLTQREWAQLARALQLPVVEGLAAL